MAGKALFTIIALGLPATWIGCSNAPATTNTPAAASNAAARPEADPAVAEALARLSPEDRALAEKQKVCPVTGEALGSMGTPYKVTVQGRTFFLCCDGCLDEIKKTPDKYLAKLPAADKK